MPWPLSEAVEHRRERHHDAADDAPFDPGRDRMHSSRQAQPIARHAGLQSGHGAGTRGDRLRTAGQLDPRLVDVAAPGNELADPHRESDDEQHGADGGEGQAHRHAGGEQRNAEREHERRHGRRRQFNGAVRRVRCRRSGAGRRSYRSPFGADVDDQEDDDPDDVDKVPVPRNELHARFMLLRDGPARGEQQDDRHRDDAGGDVEAMEADERVVSGAEQIAADRELLSR